jgi:hypothetical protein
MRPVAELAEQISETEFVPGALRGNAPAIAAAILHGRELGLPPMTALSQTHVIDGRPSISAEGQRALVLAAGHEIEFGELTDATASVRGRRHGGERWTVITWTLDRARRAGIANRPPWQRYPRAMLAARASADLCRLIFPDVVHGMAATEELDDAGPAESAETVTKRATRPVQRRTDPPAPDPTPPELPAVDGPAEAPPEPEPVPYDDATDGDLEAREREAADYVPEPSVTPAQLKMLAVVWHRYGVGDEKRRTLTAEAVGRDLDGSTKNLTRGEASWLIDNLTRILRELAAPDDPMAERIDPAKAYAELVEWLANGPAR